VAILDVDGGNARATAAELGPTVAAFPVDLADAAAVAPTVAEALSWSGGRLDVLVNNAGVFANAPLLAITVAAWDRMLAVNSRAPLLTLQASAGALERSGRGRVVNVASMAARRGTPGEAHYAASKAALVALTRVAAQELGPCGVTVNAVCPGYVLTDMGAAARSEADVARWAAQSPLGRLATVGDVAGVVAFLASDDGAYLTGQALDVSGGMVML
jgi:3-oxoacyl-[acyl-carrier protein] reductase